MLGGRTATSTTGALLALAALALVSCSAGVADTSSTPPTTGEVVSTGVSPTTSVPTTTTTTVTSAATETSQDDPAAVGRVVEVGEWRIRVASVTPDATDQLLEDEFNEPPEEGRQFFVVGLEATYTGTETGEFWMDLLVNTIGESGVEYQQGVDFCGSVPDSINQVPEVFPGGTITGNVCWAVPSEEADSLVLVAGEFPGFDVQPVFLSLDPDAEPIDETTSLGTSTLDRSDALAFGEPGTITDWSVRVISTTPDATDIILAEAGFNTPPRDGRQYFMAELEATYTGADTSNFFLDSSLMAVGDSSVSYDVYTADCGFVPDSIGFADDVTTGESVTGNVCWEIRSADANSLVMLVGEFSDPEAPMTMLSLTE